MNIQNRKSKRRRGQAMARMVFGSGLLAAGTLAYFLSSVDRVEAIAVPTILVGVLAFGIALYSRARKTREWSAAWAAYADREALDESNNHNNVGQEVFSWAGAN